MKPKLKRKKYDGAGSIWDTASVPSDVMAGMPQSNNLLMDPSQVTTSGQSTVGPLSGIQPSGIGNAVQTTSNNPSSGSKMGSIASLAGGTALSAMSGQQNTNKAIQSAYKTPLYRAADMAMPGLGVGLQVADVGMNAASKGISNQFSNQTTMGRAVKKGQQFSEYGVDPTTKIMLGQIGAGYSLATDKTQKKALEREKQSKINERQDALSMQQQYADQTIGTQQTNPVYGMKHGGSLYEMGGNVKKKSFNGIIHSDKNGVDKTEASMPEGTFVVDADHLKQAVKHGVIEPQKVSPHQGGVPIMITGGKVAPEGVISPDKVKQLLAMGVDLDKYAPNADTSIYDLAGTRKNVKHGGRMHYVGGNSVTNPNDLDYNDEPIDRSRHAKKHNKMVWSDDIAGYIDNPNYKEPKTPMTDEEKLRAAQYGILGVEAATQIGEGLWNLGRQRTPVPKPQRFISTPYTPNVSAMDAAHQASQDKALATSLYNIRQSGGGAENFNAMHANELENDLSYNAQRTGVTEAARQANTTQENQDRANYANSLYAYGVNEAGATDAFRAAKAQAVTKNIDNLMILGTQAVDVKKSQVENQGDKFTTDYANANYRAHGSGIGTFSASEYRNNKDAINSALDNISLLQSKYPTDYAQYANDVKGMNPIAANAFLISKLNK